MKIISAVLVSLISFSANASTSVARNGQHDHTNDNVQNYETTFVSSTADAYNTIRFSGHVSEDTCVNTPKHTQCGATSPIRVEQNYSFGTIVTLTYL